MKLVAIVIILVVPACTDEPAPSCIDVGCIAAPSGSLESWTPCTEQPCYCPTADGVEECSDEQLPVCPVLGCTVPQCDDTGCYCDGMACVPTGIPAPMEAGAL